MFTACGMEAKFGLSEKQDQKKDRYQERWNISEEQFGIPSFSTGGM